MNYADAKSACESIDAINPQLLMLKTKSFNDAILKWSKATRKPFRNFWIGLTNTGSVKAKFFKWADGALLAASDWNDWQTEPRNNNPKRSDNRYSNRCALSSVTRPKWKRYDCVGK